VGFLVLMVPLPRPVVAAVTSEVQLFAAATAGWALELFGVPFLLEGTWIVLPGITLEVAEVCNGLRFLMALVVLTLAFAQVTQRTVPRRIVLVASAVPVAILANAARVAVIAVGAYLVGPEVASGTIHHLIGKAVWGLTLVPLAALAWVLRRGGSRPGAPALTTPGTVPATPSATSRPGISV
jgi:exosortase